MTHLTDEEIAALRAILPELADVVEALQGGTPGPLRPFRSGTTTREEAMAYFAQAIAPHESHDLVEIGVLDDDGEMRKGIAITGNGPDGWANARRLGAAALVALPLLSLLGGAAVAIETALAELERGDADAALATLRQALERRVGP